MRYLRTDASLKSWHVCFLLLTEIIQSQHQITLKILLANTITDTARKVQPRTQARRKVML